jgi:hypothetical protein
MIVGEYGRSMIKRKIHPIRSLVLFFMLIEKITAPNPPISEVKTTTPAPPRYLKNGSTKMEPTAEPRKLEK